MIKTTVTGAGNAKDAIEKALKEFMTDKYVTVGIHEDAGQHEDDGITNAQLGAVHEFGANINHPGGTSYGYSTKQAADDGEVRFLKKGAGYAELGVTGAHAIKIPARPWLAPGVESGNEEYLKIIADGIENKKPLDKLLNIVGVVAVGKVQQYMTELRSPPNAKSTIAKKGSSNPLIDTGALRQSVTFKVTSEKPTEGV